MQNPARVSEQKSEMRQRMKKRVLEFTQFSEAEKKINLVLFQFLQSATSPKNGGPWAAYRSMGFQQAEVSIDEGVKRSTHLNWAFPVCDDKGLLFKSASIEKSRWVKNSLGVFEPSVDAGDVSIEKLAGLLIPGVAFDRRGGRLGKGLGFYDRALANFTGIKVGICLSIQLADELSFLESHDVRMDWVITENEIVNTSGKVERG